MNRNNIATVAKRKATGKPFVKGDPRCNRNGQISKERLEFNKSLRELLVSEGEAEWEGVFNNEKIKLKKVEWLVKSVWKKAIEGESWAVNFIAERIEGKVAQNVDIDHSGSIDSSMTIKVVKVEQLNGNNDK